MYVWYVWMMYVWYVWMMYVFISDLNSLFIVLESLQCVIKYLELFFK